MQPVTTLEGLAKRAVRLCGECDTGIGGRGLAPEVRLAYWPGGRSAPKFFRATIVLVSGEEPVELSVAADSQQEALTASCRLLAQHVEFLREVRAEAARACGGEYSALRSRDVTAADGAEASDHREAQERAREYWASQAETIEGGGL